MKSWPKFLLATFAAGLAASSAVAPRASAQALPETVEAINKARVTTRILFVTAHPDDEWSSLLTYLSRGLDSDVALLTITRGQGGQNAIGPEQGDKLGVIRTEELLAAGQHYGVRQFLTRAEDTGYVRTPEQAKKVWGDVALEDMVRVIRTFRPEVVINGWGGVRGGHGHHQESGIITPQAVTAAADPNMFPDQIAEGLPTWKVKLEVRLARDSATGAVELPVNSVSPIWGKSYVEMGMEGHAQHRSQGTPAFFGNPFFRRPVYLVAENEKGEVTGAFDSKILAEPITSLADRYPEPLRSELATGLTAVDRDLAAASKSALALDRTAAAKALAAAGKRLAALREELTRKHDPAERMPEGVSIGLFAAENLLWHLDRIHDRLDNALAETVALPIDTQASRHELVAGESFSVDVTFPDKPAAAAKWSVEKSSLDVPHGWEVTLDKESDTSYKFNIAIPAGAKPPSNPGDAVLPYPPPFVTLALRAEVEGYQFTIRHTVDSVEATTTGIATYPLEIVPAVTLTVEPPQIMVPVSRTAQPLKLVARVRYHGTKAAKVSVGVDTPSGWSVELSESSGTLDFSAACDQLVRFVVTPPHQPSPGAYPLHPYASFGGEKFRTSLDPIPTLTTREWSDPSDVFVHVLDLAVPASLRVGYVAAENDPLPEILRQLGIRVDLLDDVALAFGDLNRYDAIAVGIRAYELRPDLPRSNQRLLDYVKNGGTLLVQYQRDFAWNKWLPAPYPAKMPDSTSRVTDSNSPVRFLEPENPLLNSPNKITSADFEGWIQERGLYFWGTFDAKYQPVLGLTDPGQPEAIGGLVYTHFGKGVYIYTGLSFFRQLPGGVPGAYRLFVNLLSQTPRQSTSD